MVKLFKISIACMGAWFFSASAMVRLEKVTGTHKFFNYVQRQIDICIVPVCGDQSDVVKEIAYNGMWKCYALSDGEKSLGAIIFSSKIDKSFAFQGFQDAIVIKGIFVTSSDKKQDHAYATLLLQSVFWYAANIGAKSIVVKIPENVESSAISFYQQHYINRSKQNTQIFGCNIVHIGVSPEFFKKNGDAKNMLQSHSNPFIACQHDYVVLRNRQNTSDVWLGNVQSVNEVSIDEAIFDIVALPKSLQLH